MTSKLNFLVFIGFQIAVVQISGQELCSPQSVQNLTLAIDHVLHWNPPVNQDCAVSHYLIFIQSGYGEERVFWNIQTILDVSFLPVCETIRFTVVPISTQDITGLSTTLTAKMPAPRDVNLDIVEFQLSLIENNGVRLEWGVHDEWKVCLKEYRLVSHNEDDDETITIYTIRNYTFRTNLIPCTSYIFTATALYDIETQGRVSVIRYLSPAVKISPPALDYISIGTTTVDFTWSFQSLRRNRCTLSSLLIDGSPYFNISYPIVDQPDRPPISARLTNLRPDSFYYLRVAANNTAGPSDPFIVGIQTLESD